MVKDYAAIDRLAANILEDKHQVFLSSLVIHTLSLYHSF